MVAKGRYSCFQTQSTVYGAAKSKARSFVDAHSNYFLLWTETCAQTYFFGNFGLRGQ